MEETAVVQNGVMTKEVVTGKLNVALTRHTLGIQMLNDMESRLVYNEDNIPAINDYLDKARKAKKVIADEHAIIKESPLRECQIIDESKRNMNAQIDEAMTRAQTKYAALCQDVENRKRQAEADRQRKIAIQQGIDGNMISFSGRIAACKTNDELLSIERLINLEKGNKKKYAEFFDEAVAKYNTLTSLLSIQKESIKEFERLAKERDEAEKSGNDEKLIEIHEQQVTLSEKIDEAKVTVQETAINQSMTTTVIDVAEDLPEIKVKRSSWTWEVDSIKEVAKKMPDWCEIKTIDSKIDEFLKASKALWEGKEEMTVNGIRFFIKKTY